MEQIRKLVNADHLLGEMRAGGVPIDLGGITGITGDEDSIEDYILREPAVDAIPVDWLVEMSHKVTLTRTHNSIVDVLVLWNRRMVYDYL